LFACTLSGCNQINTKIGMPWTYWENGFWAVVGLLAVCVLIFIGLCGIIAGEDHSGNLIAGIIIWIVAGLLLQALPHTESGIQFIPLPPWCYVGWIAWSISIACWIALIFGWHINFSSVKADRVSAVVAIFIALGLNALLSFYSSSGVAEPKMENVACQDKIAQWEEVKQQQSDLLKRLSNDKEMLESRIKSLGVKTKRELMDHPIAHPLVEELEQLTHQIAKVQNKIVAIESVQSKLRSMEREKSLNNSGLSTEKMTDIDQKLKEELLNESDDQTPDSAVQRDILLNGLIAQP
jgi:hypothetical protein